MGKGGGGEESAEERRDLRGERGGKHFFFKETGKNFFFSCVAKLKLR